MQLTSKYYQNVKPMQDTDTYEQNDATHITQAYIYTLADSQRLSTAAVTLSHAALYTHT